MAHDQPHYPHGHSDYKRAFAIGAALNAGFIIIETVFGLMADSLALLADAGHNLSDLLGLLLAWGASYMVKRRPTQRHTYGWRKSSILAALMNAVVLMVAIGAIAWEAIRRFHHPAPVAGLTMTVVAAIGVVINTITALLFISGRKHDLNIRGAYLHMAADAGVSAGVVVAGILVLAGGWIWVDPLASLVIAVIILIGTWGLLRDAINLALDAVPKGIDSQGVSEYLAGLPGVESVHDLHIWALSTTETALTAHLVKPDSKDDDMLIEKAGRELHEHFGIDHVTLQWERWQELNHCGGSCEV